METMTEDTDSNLVLPDAAVVEPDHPTLPKAVIEDELAMGATASEPTHASTRQPKEAGTRLQKTIRKVKTISVFNTEDNQTPTRGTKKGNSRFEMARRAATTESMEGAVMKSRKLWKTLAGANRLIHSSTSAGLVKESNESEIRTRRAIYSDARQQWRKLTMDGDMKEVMDGKELLRSAIVSVCSGARNVFKKQRITTVFNQLAAQSKASQEASQEANADQGDELPFDMPIVEDEDEEDDMSAVQNELESLVDSNTQETHELIQSFTEAAVSLNAMKQRLSHLKKKAWEAAHLLKDLNIWADEAKGHADKACKVLGSKCTEEQKKQLARSNSEQELSRAEEDQEMDDEDEIIRSKSEPILQIHEPIKEVHEAELLHSRVRKRHHNVHYHQNEKAAALSAGKTAAEEKVLKKFRGKPKVVLPAASGRKKIKKTRSKDRIKQSEAGSGSVQGQSEAVGEPDTFTPDKDIEQIFLEAKRKLLAAADKKSWLQCFLRHDKDKTGFVNFDEFQSIIRRGSLIPPELLADEDLQLLFTHVDSQGTGRVEYKQNILLWLLCDGADDDLDAILREMECQEEEAVSETIRVFSKTSEGFISSKIPSKQSRSSAPALNLNRTPATELSRPRSSPQLQRSEIVDQEAESEGAKSSHASIKPTLADSFLKRVSSISIKRSSLLLPSERPSRHPRRITSSFCTDSPILFHQPRFHPRSQLRSSILMNSSFQRPTTPERRKTVRFSQAPSSVTHITRDGNVTRKAMGDFRTVPGSWWTKHYQSFYDASNQAANLRNNNGYRDQLCQKMGDPKLEEIAYQYAEKAALKVQRCFRRRRAQQLRKARQQNPLDAAFAKIQKVAAKDHTASHISKQYKEGQEIVSKDVLASLQANASQDLVVIGSAHAGTQEWKQERLDIGAMIATRSANAGTQEWKQERSNIGAIQGLIATRSANAGTQDRKQEKSDIGAIAVKISQSARQQNSGEELGDTDTHSTAGEVTTVLHVNEKASRRETPVEHPVEAQVLQYELADEDEAWVEQESDDSEYEDDGDALQTEEEEVQGRAEEEQESFNCLDEKEDEQIWEEDVILGDLDDDNEDDAVLDDQTESVPELHRNIALCENQIQVFVGQFHDLFHTATKKTAEQGAAAPRSRRSSILQDEKLKLNLEQAICDVAFSLVSSSQTQRVSLKRSSLSAVRDGNDKDEATQSTQTIETGRSDVLPESTTGVTQSTHLAAVGTEETPEVSALPQSPTEPGTQAVARDNKSLSMHASIVKMLATSPSKPSKYSSQALASNWKRLTKLNPLPAPLCKIERRISKLQPLPESLYSTEQEREEHAELQQSTCAVAGEREQKKTHAPQQPQCQVVLPEFQSEVLQPVQAMHFMLGSFVLTHQAPPPCWPMQTLVDDQQPDISLPASFIAPHQKNQSVKAPAIFSTSALPTMTARLPTSFTDNQNSGLIETVVSQRNERVSKIKLALKTGDSVTENILPPRPCMPIVPSTPPLGRARPFNARQSFYAPQRVDSRLDDPKPHIDVARSDFSPSTSPTPLPPIGVSDYEMPSRRRRHRMVTVPDDPPPAYRWRRNFHLQAARGHDRV